MGQLLSINCCVCERVMMKSLCSLRSEGQSDDRCSLPVALTAKGLHFLFLLGMHAIIFTHTYSFPSHALFSLTHHTPPLNPFVYFAFDEEIHLLHVCVSAKWIKANVNICLCKYLPDKLWAKNTVTTHAHIFIFIGSLFFFNRINSKIMK